MSIYFGNKFGLTSFSNSKYFLLQAILFYIPRWLWKNWEAGKIGALKMDLDLGIITEAEKRQKKKLLLDYLYANLKNHNFWAYRYFFCEFLALLNVLGEYIVFILYISLILILYGYISYAIKIDGKSIIKNSNIPY